MGSVPKLMPEADNVESEQDDMEKQLGFELSCSQLELTVKLSVFLENE